MPASRASAAAGPSGYWAPSPAARAPPLGPAPAAAARLAPRARPVLHRAASAAASSALLTEATLLYGGPAGSSTRPRRTHVRPPAAAGSAALVSARAPNWLRTVPGGGGGPRAGQRTDGTPGPTDRLAQPEEECGAREAVADRQPLPLVRETPPAPGPRAGRQPP